MSDRLEVPVLLTVGAISAAAVVTSWCVSPWWCALTVSVPCLPLTVAMFGMAVREDLRQD